MKHAETVTFGGSGLDRAGDLRGDKKALSAARQDSSARTLVLWRGKVLIAKERPAEVVKLPLDHPILQDANPDWVLLGRDAKAPIFAATIDAWEPQDQDLSQLSQFLDPSEQTHPALAQDQVFAELRRVMTWLSPRDAELAAAARAVFEWHKSHGFCASCGQASKPSMAGWQRDCPACGRHHFPRTDPVVIMLITHGNSVLLGRSPGWPEGMYSLLAGFVEPGETLEAAVRREVFEESGISVGEVSYLASQPWPFPASLMFGCAGQAMSTEIKIDPVEIEDAMWVSREDVMQAMAGNHPGILPARKGAIAHFLLQNWVADSLD
ncbi:MAG: NAD(+) diphosphatase [Paracoccaceae bacterium]